MSRFLVVNWKNCAICSAENSTAEAGGNPHYLKIHIDYDIDGRPAADIFDVELVYELDTCGHCGFVWRDLSDAAVDREAVLEIMKSAEWKETLTTDDPLPLSLEIERHALLLDKLGEVSLKSARAFLRMAWILDDEGNPRRSRLYRRKSIDCFLAYLEQIQDKHGITKSPDYEDNERDIDYNDEEHRQGIYEIVADLYRVSGRFHECIQFIDSIIQQVQTDYRKILIFTRQKAAIYDQSIYNLTDIYGH